MLPSVPVLFKQFVDDDLGCASYLIGDEHAGEAVIVDPAFAIEPYLEEAARREVTICCVVETHTHADHVSGHGRLAVEHGVPVRVHPASEAEFPFEPIEDGTEIDVGNVTLRVIHTPGHRPEHCCLAVLDRSRADEPWLVLTGDSLLVGDAARPDLAVEAREGARGLFRSLRRLLELPDGVEVYPGHVAGSLCGAAMSSKASTTIGFERRFNRALAAIDENEFVELSTGIRSPRPPNLERIVALNRGPFLGRPHDLPPLEGAATTTAAVLDVRPATTFEAGHVAGAINVPVSGSSFATKTAFILSPDEAIVLHPTDRAEGERAARSLRAVGFLELGGFLVDPPTPERLEPLELDELEALLARDEIELVDVREKNERDDGYIPGSRNVPYRLLRQCSEDLRGDRPVVTICETGARASIAASILVASGIDARPVTTGGIAGWQKRGNSTVCFRRCGT